MYAIVETGGKQYRVRPGETIEVERLEAEPGGTVALDRVLLISDDEGKTTVGRPAISGARVVAEVVEQARGKKLVVFKYKAKVRYRRKTGHRQSLTRLRIQEIQGEVGTGEPPVPSSPVPPSPVPPSGHEGDPGRE